MRKLILNWGALKQPFLKRDLSVFFHRLDIHWKWAAVAGFAWSSTYADENLSPDYTCLECCRVFIPHRFNPSRCGTDSASSFRSLVSQQVLQPLALSRHLQQLWFELRNLHVEILETWGLAMVSKPILIHIYVKIFIFIRNKNSVIILQSMWQS